MDDLIGIVIVVIILLVSGIRKLVQWLSAEQRTARPRSYTATPEDVKEFLQSVQRTQEARRRQPPAETVSLETVGEGDVVRGLVVREWEPPVARRVEPAPPAAGPKRKRRPKAKALAAAVPVKPAPAAAVAAHPEAAGTPAAPAPAGARPPDVWRGSPRGGVPGVPLVPAALHGMNLKQAVIWSEILAPPVGVRRRSRSGGIRR